MSDVDRGLSEIPPMFCADALANLVIGSHVSGPVNCGLGGIPQVFCVNGLVGLVIGSMCASDLVWFLIGPLILGLHLSLC